MLEFGAAAPLISMSFMWICCGCASLSLGLGLKRFAGGIPCSISCLCFQSFFKVFLANDPHSVGWSLAGWDTRDGER